VKLLFLGCCVAIVILYLIWRVDSRVFSKSQLTQLKPGMTSNEVVTVLGPPTSFRGPQWIYQRPLVFTVGIVDFNSGRLRAAYND
jgi:outer membrane protein assembly factor BamE (lipoprotein component of BamABCDE complex)